MRGWSGGNVCLWWQRFQQNYCLQQQEGNKIYELVKSSEEMVQAKWFDVAVSEKMQLEITIEPFKIVVYFRGHIEGLGESSSPPPHLNVSKVKYDLK